MTWYRFVRVLRKITRLMDEPILDSGLSRYQFDLLMQVAFEEGLTQQTCAERMNVTKGNVTQHLDRLEKQGLVRRQKDGRTKCLHLTEKGSDKVTEMMPVYDRRVREILAVLSEEELDQLRTILGKFDRRLA